MKILKFTAPALAASLLSLLTACASSTDPADAYKDETAQQIFQGGEDALRNHDNADAIKHFEALDVQYPYGRDTQTAQLHIIYAYYKNSDFLSAETAADRFIHAYPTNPNVAYAYYMRGLATYYQNMGVFERLFSVDFATRDLTQVKKSFNDFAELESRYPQSPYAPAAHQYMIYLRNVLANHQIEVAQFYFNRQAYIAAANRASMVVEHYQGAPVVPDALVIMVKSYHQLRQTDLENQAMQVLSYNYPHSIYLQEVSGKELTNQKVIITPKQENPIPPEPQQALAPPVTHATITSSTAYQTNGARGATVVPIGTIVKELHKSGWGKSTSVQQQAANQPTQKNTEQLASTQQQGNIKAKSASVSLADVWNKIASKDFFSSHSKPDNALNDAIESAAVPTTPVNVNGDRR